MDLPSYLFRKNAGVCAVDFASTQTQSRAAGFIVAERLDTGVFCYRGSHPSRWPTSGGKIPIGSTALRPPGVLLFRVHLLPEESLTLTGL